MHHSENNILFLQRSAPFVKQPSSCCGNYDSPSGMQCWVPWWHPFALLGDNNSNSAKRAGVLSGRSPPGASCSTPEASSAPPPSPPLCSPRSGHKVLSYSHQTVWLEAAADVTVFVFGFVSSLRLFSLPCISSALAARALGVWVFKKLKKRGLWKKLRPWLLHLVNWVSFFSSLPLQPKVQSKQPEVNGFIFSCARQFVDNREPLLFVLFTINANIY